MSDICWCPDSRHLYLVREDERLLRDFWVINSLDDRPSLTTYRYEFPGDKNVTQNELVIVDVIGRTVKKTDISKWPDQYINPLCVTKDSKYLFFERTKRTWDEVDLCSVNLSTMEVKEIIHEVDKPYRDPHARSVAILNDGKDILFRSFLHHAHKNNTELHQWSTALPSYPFPSPHYLSHTDCVSSHTQDIF